MRSALKIFICFLAFLCAIGLCTLAQSSTQFSNLYITISIITAIIAGSVKPEVSLALFLFILPIFGNKPGTQQAYYLLIIGMGLNLGLSLSILFRKFPKLAITPLLPGFWYVVFSLLSLFPVSYQIFMGWFRASQTNLSNFSLLSWNTASILLAREDDPAYPLLSVFWTGLAFALSYFVSCFASQQPKLRSFFCWALLAGFLCSLIVGLINYYGFLNLAGLRELDPVVNPGGTQYRLQSWFGHSGWFAEYVTMLAPFSLLILTLTIPYWTRVSILLFLLLVGEIVLILTFQRGGWLSYPLTLIAVWTSIYVLRRLDRGNSNILLALKASAIKILISLPLTLLISFMILKVFGSHFGLDQYADRFKDIAKTSDRSDFIKAGFSLGALNPILGQGSESFALQYRREYRKKDGAYFGQIDLPLHGTAHNLYAQTFAGKGTLGLLSLLTIMFVIIKRGASFVIDFKARKMRADQIVSLACICSIIACFIYGFVQELFYVQALQYVFFAVTGIIASLPLEQTENNFKINKRVKYAVMLVAALFAAHLIWHIQKGRPYSDPYGCFNEESNEGGEHWRWCGVRSSIEIANNDIESKTLTLEAAPPQYGKGIKHLIQVEACNQVIFSKEMLPSERASFPIGKEICSGSRPGYTRINAYSGEYFIPSLENKESSDRRVLALRWILTK